MLQKSTLSWNISIHRYVERTKKIITTTQCVKVYLQRLCIFGRDGGNGGKDELRRVVALHKLHTPVKTTNSKRERPCQLDDAEPLARAAPLQQCHWPEMLMRFHQETEVSVLAEVRGQEYFGRLAVQFSARNRRGKRNRLTLAKYYDKGSSTSGLTSVPQGSYASTN